MDLPSRNKLFLFNGYQDATYNELQTWRSIVCGMAGANQIYVEKLNEAADFLRVFADVCQRYDKTGNNSKSAAERTSYLLRKISDFHKVMFGDFMKFTNPEGPFGDLMKASDREFGLLKIKSTAQLKEHEKLQKTAANAWKYYMRRAKKRDKLELKLAKTRTAEEIKQDTKFFGFRGKADLALSEYNICFENEVKHRDLLAEQNDSLKKEFLREEKAKLDTMFGAINDVLDRIQKLTPQGLDDLNEDLNFEPVEAKTKAMARAGWEAHLKEYKFPEQNGGKQSCKDNDNDDDDASASEDEDDSDNEDSEDEFSKYGRGGKKEMKVKSPAAPKLNKDESGMNDVLKEILDSLDTEPKPSFAIIQSKREKEKWADQLQKDKAGRIDRSPEASTEDKSPDSSNDFKGNRSGNTSPVSRRRRSRASSPVPKKRKPLKSRPQTGKHRSSPECQSREPSPKTIVDDLTWGETKSASNQRRQKSVDADKALIIQDFDAEEEYVHSAASIYGQNKWAESTLGMPAVDVTSDTVCLKREDRYGSKVQRHEESDAIRSESRRRRRESKQAKDLEEKGRLASTTDSRASQDESITSHDVIAYAQVSNVGHHGGSIKEQEKNKTEDETQNPSTNSVSHHGQSSKVKDINNTKVSLPHDSVIFKSNVTVYATKDHEKSNSKPISIRKGMKLRQTRCMDQNGMAYGFKKTKLGLRKYGFYPAAYVSLVPPDLAEH